MVTIMAKTHNQFVSEVYAINPNIEIIGTYTKALDRVRVRCKECGKIWEPKAYSLTQGKSCPHCSAIKGSKNNKGKTGLKNNNDFLLQLHKAHPEIESEGEYINTHTNVNFICKRCGNRWSAKPYSVLQGHGCPQCAKTGTSFMEQFIKLCFCSALGEEAVLSRDKELIGMELDIVIPSKKIAIEPGCWKLHKKSVKRDSIKREKCREKGYRLITIYDMFPENVDKPFDSDCFTFSVDLNKSDHEIIYNLVSNLFSICKIKHSFSSVDYQNIEKVAYELSKSKLHDTFVEEIKAIHPNITVLGKYINSYKRITVKCDICGFQWNAVPANLLSGDGCRKCGAKSAHEKAKKTQDEFIRQIALVNPDVEIIGEYTGRHNPIKTRCKICGHIWFPIAASLLRGSSHKGSRTVHKEMKTKG